MHIILRFELEQAMIESQLRATDVPAAWHEKLHSLLGVRPPNNREGCLQDIHWSRPSFGYFPTYALGNFYAAQLYESANADAAVAEGVASGDVAPLLDWLRENIHQHGRKYTPGELIVRATGRPLGHEPFVRYARAKFGEIYGL
jgi:carboxypeptidase Taq